MDEDPLYLQSQLVTYLGNKRALLRSIDQVVRSVRSRLGGRLLSVWDPFAGSGAVSRLFMQHCFRVLSSDLEEYAEVLGSCYLKSDPSSAAEVSDWISALPLPSFVVAPNEAILGPIEEHYAPRDDSAIKPHERVFYTRANARRIDFFRRQIETAPAALRPFLLGPLLYRASVHANTSGVFKGFYKNKNTGIGQFGGSGRDALSRILGEITLEPPVWSRFHPEVAVTRGDALTLASEVGSFDLVYLDPPYNQHPYGSNYFMLNLIASGLAPKGMSRVSGIPCNWNRSRFNVRRESLELIRELLCRIEAPFVLISFSDEGFIEPDAMDDLLGQFGSVQTIEMSYPTFRGARNLKNRTLYVKERLLLLER